MRRYKNSFIVSAIAILFSAGANAATPAVEGLATPNYVRGAVGALNAQLKEVAKSGSYNDLTNKPTIPAAQVNSDWNATTGKAQILNKPTLGALAAKSSVSNNEIAANAGIAKDKLASGVQTSLGKADSALQSVSGGAAVAGKVATAVVENGTAVAVTMDYVKIPVGSPTSPTSVAQIWVQ